MSKHHIGLDVALALVYCFICTVLLLVLSLPLPYKGIIKNRMGPIINTLLYGLIAPVWVLVNSVNRLRTLMGLDIAFKTSQAQQYKHSSKVIKQQRNILIGLGGVLTYVLLLRFFTLLGGSPYLEQHEGFRPVRAELGSGSAVARTTPRVSAKGDSASTRRKVE